MFFWILLHRYTSVLTNMDAQNSGVLEKVTPAWKNMAIFCIYVQFWGVKFVLPDSPTWTSPEVGINEDLQAITYIYIGVISHNPLIRSPLIPSTSFFEPGDIQAVEICPKILGLQPRRVCSGTSSAVLTIAVLTVVIHRRSQQVFWCKKRGHGWAHISQMPPEGMEYIYLHENP